MWLIKSTKLEWPQKYREQTHLLACYNEPLFSRGGLINMTASRVKHCMSYTDTETSECST
jgi:hypothetical protein